jgi:hypothetical protein
MKNSYNKIKTQYDDLKEKYNENVRLYSRSLESQKAIEEKNIQLKFQLNSTRTQIRDKDMEIAKLNQELKNIETYRLEKERHERDLHNSHKLIKQLKEDLERRNKKIKDMDRNDLFLFTTASNFKKTLSRRIGYGKSHGNKKSDEEIEKLNKEIDSLKKEVDTWKGSVCLFRKF